MHMRGPSGACSELHRGRVPGPPVAPREDGLPAHAAADRPRASPSTLSELLREADTHDFDVKIRKNRTHITRRCPERHNVVCDVIVFENGKAVNRLASDRSPRRASLPELRAMLGI